MITKLIQQLTLNSRVMIVPNNLFQIKSAKSGVIRRKTFESCRLKCEKEKVHHTTRKAPLDSAFSFATIKTRFYLSADLTGKCKKA